jgi:hypothetical protein
MDSTLLIHPYEVKTMANVPLSNKQREEILKALKARFEKNPNRHKGLAWAQVQAKLEANAGKLWSLNEMEKTGGEPDVVGHDKKTGEYIFYDCAARARWNSSCRRSSTSSVFAIGATMR